MKTFLLIYQPYHVVERMVKLVLKASHVHNSQIRCTMLTFGSIYFIACPVVKNSHTTVEQPLHQSLSLLLRRLVAVQHSRVTIQITVDKSIWSEGVLGRSPGYETPL